MPGEGRYPGQVPADVVPSDATESVWTLVAFWVVAFAGTALFAAVMIAPRWEQKQIVAERVRQLSRQCKYLRDSNDHLQRVIDALRHDPDFTAQMARHELGYVDPAERRVSAPVRDLQRPKPPDLESPPDSWAPFIRLFAHDRLVRQAALITAAVFVVAGLAFFRSRE